MLTFKVISVGALLFCATGVAGIEEQLISSQEIKLHQNFHLKGWLNDFSEAQKQAVEKEQPILIAFLGPSWCPWSDQLESEILVDQTFLASLQKEVVFLKVDIPEDFNREGENTLPYQQLKNKYHVDECPTLVLVGASGQEIAKLNYLPLESREFAGYIKEILADFHQVNLHAQKKSLHKLEAGELQSLYVKAGRLADTTFKKVLLHQGLKEDKGSYFLLEQYGHLLAEGHFKSPKLSKIRNKILARDPKNKQGTLLKLAIMDFEALSSSVPKVAKSEKAIKPLLEYLKKFGKQDTENSWRVEMMISQYFFGKNQIEEALKHAQASLEMAPPSLKEEIHQSIDYLQTCLNAP